MSDTALVLLFFQKAEQKNRNEITKQKRNILREGYLLKWNAPFYSPGIRKTVRGKPYDSVSPERYFSLADCGGGLAAVFADQAVGIDMERDRMISDRLFKHMPEEETAYLQRELSGEKRRILFLRLWTMREAYVKMTGDGLTGAVFERSFLPQLKQILISERRITPASDSQRPSGSRRSAGEEAENLNLYLRPYEHVQGSATAGDESGPYYFTQFLFYNNIVVTAACRERLKFDVVQKL